MTMEWVIIMRIRESNYQTRYNDKSQRINEYRGNKKFRQEKYYYVYISTNKIHSVLYTGVTNNLLNRDDQHKIKLNKNSFTAKYNVNKVVYYETYKYVNDAIAREKQIKAGSRQRKIDLIRGINPSWKDLTKDFYK